MLPIQGRGLKIPEEVWMLQLYGDWWGERKARYSVCWGFIALQTDTGWHERALWHQKFDRGDILHEVQDMIDLHGEGNLYFSMNLFSKPERRQEFVLPSQWLYADLDESVIVHHSPCHPDARRLFWMGSPTLLWETSPGRQQAAWLLSAPLNAPNHRKLNQRLTYAMGADKGGWGSTKVLRIPDSRNFKYRGEVWGQTLWAEYDYAPVPKCEVKLAWAMESLRHIKGLPQDVPVPVLKLRSADAVRLRKKHRKRLIQASVKSQLMMKDTRGRDRSKVLWQMEKAMLRTGIPPGDVLVLVRDSVWNKYRGRQREVEQLWHEINKAKAAVELEEKAA